jgi:hypothetical protein
VDVSVLLFLSFRRSYKLLNIKSLTYIFGICRYNHWFKSNQTCTTQSNWHAPELGSMHQVRVYGCHLPAHVRATRTASWACAGYTGCHHPHAHGDTHARARTHTHVRSLTRAHASPTCPPFRQDEVSFVFGQPIFMFTGYVLLFPSLFLSLLLFFPPLLVCCSALVSMVVRSGERSHGGGVSRTGSASSTCCTASAWGISLCHSYMQANAACGC